MTLKFIFDRIASALGLLLLWPVLLATALYVRLLLPGGPVLFRQQRVGRHGRPFTIHKFRTMEQGADGTKRVPRAAAFLRRSKLDELPELWNVLRGEMSLVGPRPDVPGYADCLEGADRELLLLRPGITGPATMKYRDEEALLARVGQVISEQGETADGKGGTVRSVQEYNDRVIWPDKVRINRYYLHHYSFLRDLQMIACTLLGRRMEYGGETI